MERQQTVAEEKWGLGSGPVVLTGRPGSCHGYVELVNRSAEEVEPRAIAMTGFDPGSRLTQPPAMARVSARLAPHARVRAAIEVTLDPRTPPGSYTGRLHCGSQREEVVIHVLEHWDLRVLPPLVTITARPAEKVVLRLSVTNLGNVELALPNSVHLHLSQKMEFTEYLNDALIAAGKQGYAKFLDRFVQGMAEDGVSPATVKFKFEDPKVRAGETRQVDLEIDLPEEMKKDRVYTGKLRLKNAYVRVEVECGGPAQASPRRPK